MATWVRKVTLKVLSFSYRVSRLNLLRYLGYLA
jgi:hypothetical protein